MGLCLFPGFDLGDVLDNMGDNGRPLDKKGGEPALGAFRRWFRHAVKNVVFATLGSRPLFAELLFHNQYLHHSEHGSRGPGEA